MTVTTAVNKMVYTSLYFFDNASIKTFEDAGGTRIFVPQPRCVVVTSTQYKSVLDTIRTGGPRFVFEDEEIPICSTPYCCAFITMNPGYTGRYELPESVKTLILYRLSKALLLSPEHHYDWKLYLLPSPPPPHPCTKPF
jgi:hypothetical protein